MVLVWIHQTYANFSHSVTKYTVPIIMNISKESINWLLMPKKDDQLIKASDLRQGKFSNGLSTQDIQIWANGYKIAYVS